LAKNSKNQKKAPQQTKKILYEFLRDGTITLEEYDVNGAEIVAIEDIFGLFDEFLLYDPNIFEERL
jgi:hypothetical protein